MTSWLRTIISLLMRNVLLSRARTRLTTVKESLKACKELLHYKRDELKKLWLDGVDKACRGAS